jgi:predicted ATPase/transcriptional regulator with XRE-family HTH domain
MRDDAEPPGEGRSPFGHLLREFRVAASLSQESLAERAGVSSNGISVLERGARRAPHRDTVALLASALDLSADDRARLQAAAVRAAIPRSRGSQPMSKPAHGRHNLPLSLTSFHGRDAELHALTALMGEQRLVTLTGIGGVGKTRLALETGRALIERFQDGVWYVELAPLHDAGLVLQRIAATFGVSVRYEEASQGTPWIAQLVQKRLLIVLDNCEHLLDATATVTQEILERCPDVRILATSREALRVGGEYVVRVDPLAVPAVRSGRPPSLSDLRASPAIQMFLDRARHAAPTVKLSEDAAAWQTLGNVCARLDGMPLAIELAAARMNAMTLETLSRALAGRIHVLTTGARTALPRHQTLHALIDWSYDLLSAPERHVFRRLAVFSGGWTLESAQAVCAHDDVGTNEVLPILSSLVDKSLVVAIPASAAMRYNMLETTRAYALDRLTNEGEHDVTARRHAEHFAALLRRNNATWGTVPLTGWLNPLESELDNLRAALQWCLVEGRDVLLGATIADAQDMVFGVLSLAHEGFRWCERALAALAPNPPPALEAPLQLTLANLCIREAYHERALEAALRSAALYRTLSDSFALHNPSARGCLASALSLAGWALVWLRRYDEAATIASEAVAVAREESANVLILGWALTVKSFSLNDIVTRRALLDEALALSRSLPSGYHTEGFALIGFSFAEFDAGNIDRAQGYAADAADYFLRSTLLASFASWALGIASTCACLAGDVDAALAYACDALSAFDGGVYFFVLDLMDFVQVIASVLTARGRQRDAARLVGACEAAFTNRGVLRPNYSQVLYDRTIVLLRESLGNADLDGLRAEGRTWSYEHSVAAGLDFELRSRSSASSSYG